MGDTSRQFVAAALRGLNSDVGFFDKFTICSLLATMVVVKAIKAIKGLAAAVFMKSHAMKKKAMKVKAAEAVKANRSLKATKSKPRWVLRVRRWVAGLGVQAKPRQPRPKKDEDCHCHGDCKSRRLRCELCAGARRFASQAMKPGRR